MLCQPVTLPCGHAFCRLCLERLLDHASVCPICRRNLFSFRRRWNLHINFALWALLQRCFPTQTAARLHELETIENHPVGSLAVAADSLQSGEGGGAGVRKEGEWIAVFVCMVAWPGMPCVLHVFEPRYRLMMRRVWLTTRMFGMCSPGFNTSSYSEHGTVLRMQNFSLLPDGRALVASVGVCPFRVLERGVHDSYAIARVACLSDTHTHTHTHVPDTLTRTDNHRQTHSHPHTDINPPTNTQPPTNTRPPTLPPSHTTPIQVLRYIYNRALSPFLSKESPTQISPPLPPSPSREAPGGEEEEGGEEGVRHTERGGGDMSSKLMSRARAEIEYIQHFQVNFFKSQRCSDFVKETYLGCEF